MAAMMGVALILASSKAHAQILYVTNGSNIQQFTSPSTAGTTFASGLNTPDGRAFDSAGNLYVANNGGNTIEEFNSSGVGSIFASTGLNHPRSLAFDQSGNLYTVNNSGSSIEKFTPAGVGSVFANTGLSNAE